MLQLDGKDRGAQAMWTIEQVFCVPAAVPEGCGNGGSDQNFNGVIFHRNVVQSLKESIVGVGLMISDWG